GLCPERAVGPGGSADDRCRLAPQRGLAVRPGGPVDGVLEYARDGAVVLRRRHQDRVRGGDRLAQRGDLGRRLLVVMVAVVVRDRGKAVEQLQADAVWHQVRRRAQERGVVRALAETAGDGQDAHRDQPCLTSEKLAVRRTWSSRRRPPPGSGAFQSMPNSRRSMTPSRSRPTRWLPHGSSPAPVTTTAIWTGLVVPLMVISPVSVPWSPSRSTAVERKLMRGW